ncbi:MarR family transcriptional regulator [Pseudomonas sp. B21-056]|uniref:MarR family transcriptional regulator n=1 Tax=Pseudomonas sp. B21-056 TaxID=2895495 RepID=UPI0022305C06|nr:MarR family transcriptional regulator [Pseudomonas sp. B21-056]UZE24593.1 MarR family transcriptional regulator [Pseudomonas sp. B21-056]
MKGQDILLMYKMASLHAQEEMSPTGNPTVAWGGLSSIDLLPDDYTQEFQFITSASPEKSWDNLEVAIKGLIDADSFPWEGWDANDLSQKSPATKWEDRYTLRALAESLGLSKSEISNSIVRCREAGLVTNDYETSLPKVNRPALLKITEHALKYFFPVKPGALARGIPTGFASPVLSKHLKSAGENIHVWPDPHGTERGQTIDPLYKTVPEAVKNDRTLYHYLALVDSIRLGGPRETSVAIKLLKKGMGL